jgi:UTP--glucose-1-phosphate uridylyltransferase
MAVEGSPGGVLSAFIERMQAEGLPDVAIQTFEYYYGQLRQGQTGLIPESALQPIETLPDAEAFPAGLAEAGRAALSQTVLLQLNGGLGTSMGLDKAKSLLIVKDGLSFLDIIALQTLHGNVPLVLMNSFSTRRDSLSTLQRYPGLWTKIPLDFVQHRFPKISQADLSPATWPANKDLEWYPPGHGDIYPALLTSGILDTLLAAGYRYAFVSNADNLGAVIEPAILGYLVENHLPFMMEAADRTVADRKGGHVGRLLTGQLILRESAQCPEEEMADFQDIERHRYFNTNNLWLDLAALKGLLEARGDILGLPMIVNRKTVDPRDGSSTPVYQLETAMGSAIGVFSGARAVRVPRSRFAPVKTTDDLLAVRSDAYVLTDEYRVAPNPARKLRQLAVSLDPSYYRLIEWMEQRFPYGPPHLLECERLSVQGDICFGRDVVLKGVVDLINDTGRQLRIEDGAVIEGSSG